MATSIGVEESTRDRLERVKRELGAPSLEATIARLLEERTELKARRASAQLLRSLLEHRRELAAFTRRHHIRALSVFGSALHGDARKDSDLDLLVQFAPTKTPGLMGLGAMQRELSSLLGVNVDLQTPGFLSKHIRDRVAAEALEIHVAT